MSSVITPNMNLTLPTPEQEPGPLYAQEINNDLSILDGHDHTPGYGTAITPLGLNINTDLTFNNHSAVSLFSLGLQAQASPSSLNGSLSISGVDLYYTDGNGNQVRITNSGSIVGTSGSISGLVAPASASFNAGTATFIFQSNTNVAANLDARNVILRKSTASSPGITLSAPTALSSNYTLTLPSAPPSPSRYLTMDASGNVGFLDLAGSQLTTNVGTGKIDFIYTLSSVDLTLNGGNLVLQDAGAVHGVALSGARINGLDSLSTQANQLILGQAGALNSGNLGLYINSTPNPDTLFLQRSVTRTGNTYPLVVSTFYNSSQITDRILYGVIAANGAVSAGGGFTNSVNAGTFTHTVTFTQAFSAPPAVTVTPINAGGTYNNAAVGLILSLNSAGFSYQTPVTTGGVGAISFIAIGQF